MMDAVRMNLILYDKQLNQSTLCWDGWKTNSFTCAGDVSGDIRIKFALLEWFLGTKIKWFDI
jgi:hypothetical protein